jgi:GNAT superfamily N-acetyltransferase
VVPLVVAGWRQWLRLAISIGVAVATFFATSPYVLVHPHQAWSDASRVQRLARDGWLGFEHDSWALFSFTGKLWSGLGPVLVFAVLGLVLALRRRARADLILASFVLAYLVDLLTIRAHFDRYVLPLVPPLAVLAGRQRALAPLMLGLAIVPLVWAVGDDARLTRTDTRVVAARWIVGHLPRAASVAADSSTPPIGRRVLDLQLPGPGRPHDANRDVARPAQDTDAARLPSRARTRPYGSVGIPLPAVIRRAVREDAPAVAGIFRESRADAMPWLPVLHTPEEDLGWFQGALGGEAYVFEEEGRVLGYAVLREDELHDLYVAPDSQGRGVGSALFDRAREARPEGFRLWVFRDNRKARRFYEARGCRQIDATAGVNEEGLPDVLYEWKQT